MSESVDKVHLVIRPSRIFASEKLSFRVAGNEEETVNDALKKAGFQDGDLVEVKWVGRGDKAVVDPRTDVKTGQTWRVERDGEYEGNIRIGKRHFSDRGWECENLTSGIYFPWINDGHWTYAQSRYRMLLVSEACG